MNLNHNKNIETWNWIDAFSLKGTLSNFQLLPNATKNTNKFKRKILQNKIEQVFWGWSTGLQRRKWIAIDFWTGCPEIVNFSS